MCSCFHLSIFMPILYPAKWQSWWQSTTPMGVILPPPFIPDVFCSTVMSPLLSKDIKYERISHQVPCPMHPGKFHHWHEPLTLKKKKKKKKKQLVPQNLLLWLLVLCFSRCHLSTPTRKKGQARVHYFSGLNVKCVSMEQIPLERRQDSCACDGEKKLNMFAPFPEEASPSDSSTTAQTCFLPVQSSATTSNQSPARLRTTT